MANKLAKLTPPVLALEETRYPYLDQNLIEFSSPYPLSSCCAQAKGGLSCAAR